MDTQKIGKFIYESRKKQKLTQEELAEKLGVTNRTISRWETGKCMPDMLLYDELCKELKITINELLAGENINTNDYQKTFEKNVINVVNEVDTRVKKNNVILKVTITTLLTLITIFLILAFYQSFYFTENYSEKDMQIGKSPDNTLLLQTNTTGIIKTFSIIKDENNEKIGIIFITFKRSLENIHNDKKNKNIDFIDYTNPFTTSHGIMVPKSVTENNYKIYYTKVDITKLYKKDEKEINKIIKKSQLIYDSQKS